jgi:hypothetical protein
LRYKTGGDAANGMTITLANLNPDNPSKTYAIKVSEGVFSVAYDGSMVASKADIAGTIYAETGKIGSSSKTSSDGWTLAKGRLYSGSSSNRVELNSLVASALTQEENETTSDFNTRKDNAAYAFWAGNATAQNAKFSVTKAGIITAKEGTIGGWTLATSTLTGGSMGLASSGTYRFWAGADASGSSPTFNGSTYFYVTSAGKVTCKNADV